MATGEAWNIEEEAPDVPRPWAQFDIQAVVDIPVDWNEWLADKETTYASHSVTTSPELECTNPTSGESQGAIKMRIQASTLNPPVLGRKYWVTCHIVGADGQEEDQTLYLRAAAK